MADGFSSTSGTPSTSSQKYGGDIESRSLAGELLELTADGVIVIHEDHIIRFANRAAAVFLGLSRATSSGQRFDPPDHLGDHFRLSIRRVDGSDGVADAHAIAIFLEGIPAQLIALHDITEQLENERVQTASYRISQATLIASDLQELLRSIHRILGELMPADNFYVALLDAGTGFLTFPYYVDDRDPRPKARQPGRGLTEYVMRMGRTQLLHDSECARLVAAGEAEPMGTPSLSWLGAPLSVNGAVIGAVVAQTYDPGALYGEKEKEILTIVSESIAMAIWRRQAETTAFESGRMLSTILANLPGMAYRCANDQGSTMLYVSQGAYDLTGYPADELCGAHPIKYNDLVHPDDRERLESTVHDAVDKMARYQLEYRLITADGSERWVWENGQPVASPVGGVQYLEGFVADITEWKKTETAERHQRELNETLADIVMALASQVDRTRLLDEILRQAMRLVPSEAGNIILADDSVFSAIRWIGYDEAGERLLNRRGYSTDEVPHAARAIHTGEPMIVSDTHAEPSWVIFPETAWVRSHLIVPISGSDKPLGVLRLDSKQPGRFTQKDVELLQPVAHAASVALENSRLIRAAEQRAAELEALREATLGLTSQLELSAVLDVILQATHRLLPGISNAHIFLHKAGELEFGAALWADGKKRGAFIRPRENGITATVARDGKMIVADDMRSHPLFANAPADWHGAIIGIPLKIGDRTVGVMNIASEMPRIWQPSERKTLQLLADQAAIAIENAQLHEEIRRHASLLEERVARRTVELLIANERLKELDRMKSEFVASVSHELRTPLTNIKSYLHLLEHGKPEKRDHYFSTLSRETELLQRLIEDLLQLSRLDLGTARIEVSRVDINQLASTILAELSAESEKAGLTVETHPATELPTVLADPRLLTRVFINLMSNSINYTPRGGRILVETSSALVSDRGETPPEGRPGWVSFCVGDTGLGLTQEDRDHVFERFYRGVAARSTSAPGTGLGLALSVEIVTRFGGHISVESEAGKGSRFSIWLPAAPAGVEPQAA